MITTCPIADCNEDDLYGRTDLYEHLREDHSRDELLNTLIDLADDLASARANTECQICGNYGATPGDHPLCDTCEKEVRG
ncbi:hypothetical protein OG455_41625 [Kitasatospora sp. NBC_01287]|uniref:hypothetical protein n=1 Tax=Kitasatospora sp. NBC_01287 TaxID=2903573 RepID=UPI00224EAAAD|nr:hypothetical protein [Kitasatospora sp. NBC_01287]MCX4750985.1 hypothetical protein [Kitasatospora sp. NBC_01287]MCX4751764.1 hypothetical protein [Kitasatospora sp. NBC_01287]MCX4751944.1 hypothetical protein [Kitasatospora sp. NBC_01287]